MRVCACACSRGVYTHISVSSCKGQQLVSEVFITFHLSLQFFFLFLFLSSPTESRPHDWLLGYTTCLFPAPILELQVHTTTPGFRVGSGYLNPDPNVCVVGTLFTEPSPQPLLSLLTQVSNWLNVLGRKKEL